MVSVQILDPLVNLICQAPVGDEPRLVPSTAGHTGVLHRDAHQVNEFAVDGPPGVDVDRPCFELVRIALALAVNADDVLAFLGRTVLRHA